MSRSGSENLSQSVSKNIKDIESRSGSAIAFVGGSQSISSKLIFACERRIMASPWFSYLIDWIDFKGIYKTFVFLNMLADPLG